MKWWLIGTSVALFLLYVMGQNCAACQERKRRLKEWAA